MKRALKFSATVAMLAAIVSPMAKTQAAPSNQVWVATWGASQQTPEPANSLPADDLRDATLRQIFHLSVGGASMRVHLSNAFGTEALHLTSVHIARPVSPASAAIDPASDRPLMFAVEARRHHPSWR